MDKATGDDVAKARITTHMNRSHQRELSHYLRHYAGLSAGASRSPELVDVSLSGMSITTAGSDGEIYPIPFEPPLSSLAEVRARVVAMDVEARDALGISDIYLTVYTPPRGFDIFVFAGVAVYFLCYFTLPWNLPGTPLWSFLTAVWPGGPLRFRELVEKIFWPVVVIHLIEALWVHRSRLAPHGVDPGSRLWWQWVLSTFFEGACTFWRIDALLEAKRKEKAAASH